MWHMAPTSAPTRMLSATPPKGGGVTRGVDLHPTLLLHSTLSGRCNSPIRARTSAFDFAVGSGEGSNSPAAHRRTVCRLTPMVGASLVCQSGPETNRPLALLLQDCNDPENK